MIRGALYWIKESIRVRRIKDLIAIHHSDQILGVGEVDDVVRIAREHVDALDIVACDFEFDNLPLGIVKVALLDKAMTSNHNKELPLGVMPVLPLGDARLRDVDAHLAAIQGMHQLGERASLVHIHLQREGDLLLGKIREISGVKFLGETAVWNLRDGQGLGLFGEFV